MDNAVFLAACSSYDQAEVDLAVRRCLDHFGGAASFARPGMRIVLKPNLLMPQRPDAATTTHPAVMSALARAFAETGAEVIVAESPGGPFNVPLLHILYRICGMEALGDIPGVKLNYDTSTREAVFPDGQAVSAMPLLVPVLDADLVVSAAKMKTHGLAYMTGAVKNIFGAVPGLTKAKLHARFSDPDMFNRMLVDLCEFIQPGFSIVDGIVGMEGHGPSGGTPKHAGVLVASRNPYAADLACARIMGFSPDRIPVLVDALSRGLIPSSADKLDWHGDALGNIATFFRPATNKLPGDGLRFIPRPVRALIHRRVSPYPAIRKSCIGCGKCAEICPRQIITVSDKRASIEYETCIKCYCCHEICPVQAIDLVAPRKRPPMGRL